MTMSQKVTARGNQGPVSDGGLLRSVPGRLDGLVSFELEALNSWGAGLGLWLWLGHDGFDITKNGESSLFCLVETKRKSGVNNSCSVCQ